MDLVVTHSFFKSNYRNVFVSILVLLMFLEINHSNAQNRYNFFSESSNLSSGGTCSCLKIEDNIFVRHDRGYTYKLIDTAGLFVFILEEIQEESTLVYVYNNKKPIPTIYSRDEKVTKAYFSKSICGELIRMDYFTLKKHFGKQYPNFIKAAKKIPDEDLINQSDSHSNLTVVNSLFKH